MTKGKRKSPIHHKVRNHNRRKVHVQKYERGHGEKKDTKKRTKRLNPFVKKRKIPKIGTGSGPLDYWGKEDKPKSGSFNYWGKENKAKDKPFNFWKEGDKKDVFNPYGEKGQTKPLPKEEIKKEPEEELKKELEKVPEEVEISEPTEEPPKKDISYYPRADLERMFMGDTEEVARKTAKDLGFTFERERIEGEFGEKVLEFRYPIDTDGVPGIHKPDAYREVDLTIDLQTEVVTNVHSFMSNK